MYWYNKLITIYTDIFSTFQKVQLATFFQTRAAARDQQTRSFSPFFKTRKSDAKNHIYCYYYHLFIPVLDPFLFVFFLFDGYTHIRTPYLCSVLRSRPFHVVPWHVNCRNVFSNGIPSVEYDMIIEKIPWLGSIIPQTHQPSKTIKLISSWSSYPQLNSPADSQKKYGNFHDL